MNALKGWGREDAFLQTVMAYPIGVWVNDPRTWLCVAGRSQSIQEIIQKTMCSEGRQLRRLLYSGRRTASSLLLMQNKTRNAVDAAVTPFDSALDCNVIFPPATFPTSSWLRFPRGSDFALVEHPQFTVAQILCLNQS